MSSCKLICKPWYIILLCRDCAARCRSARVRSFSSWSGACVILIYSLWSSCISDWGLCIARRRDPFPWREQLLLAHNPSSLGAGTAGTGGWRHKARQSRLTAAGMFTDQGLAAPWRHGSLSSVSSVLQGEGLKTKMLALNFKNSR